MDKVEQGIVVAACGWIFAGALSILVYYYQVQSIRCACPAILVNTTTQKGIAECGCSTPIALLGVGILVIIVGLSLIIMRKRIVKLRDKILAEQQERGKKAKSK